MATLDIVHLLDVKAVKAESTEIELWQESTQGKYINGKEIPREEEPWGRIYKCPHKEELSQDDKESM